MIITFLNKDKFCGDSFRRPRKNHSIYGSVQEFQMELSLLPEHGQHIVQVDSSKGLHVFAAGIRAEVASISFEHVWHNHMPLLTEVLSSGVIFESYLGPPAEAAQICAATPTFVATLGSSFAPEVGFLQSGLLHFTPTRLAKTCFVFCVNSSLFLAI